MGRSTVRQLKLKKEKWKKILTENEVGYGISLRAREEPTPWQPLGWVCYCLAVSQQPVKQNNSHFTGEEKETQKWLCDLSKTTE